MLGGGENHLVIHRRTCWDRSRIESMTVPGDFGRKASLRLAAHWTNERPIVQCCKPGARRLNVTPSNLGCALLEHDGRFAIKTMVIDVAGDRRIPVFVSLVSELEHRFRPRVSRHERLGQRQIDRADAGRIGLGLANAINGSN